MNFENLILENKWKLKFPVILEGGGVVFRKFFLEKVKATGKTYNRAFEWCSGAGVIGYDILSHGYCNHIVFNDKFSLAIDTCLQNAEYNQITHLVTTYVGDSISTIPTTEKWDLVVANPPHSSSREHWETLAREMFANNNQEPWDEEMFENWARLIVDEDWNSHINFFDKIKRYLSDNADIFICENNRYMFLEQLFKKDFTIVCMDPFPELGPNAIMYHLKVKE